MEHLPISVIIPSYNSLSTIERTLRTVLNQTQLPDEVFVIDDCSRDSTTDIVRRIFLDFPKSVKCTLLLNDVNSGPSITRNRGIDNAKNSWIAFLDSDDLWHPQKLEIQWRLLQKTGSKLIGSLGSVKMLNSRLFEDQIQTRVIKSDDLLWKNYFQTPSVLVYKDAEVRFRSDMSFAEDYELWTRVVRRHGQGIFTEPALFSLGKPAYIKGGLSSQLVKMEIGELQVLNHEKNFIKRYAAMCFSLVKFARRVIIRLIA